MASCWIESHTKTLRLRKLRDCARGLRIRPVYLLGHLHALWHVALEQQEDGDFSSWSDESIAESSDYPGDAPQYVRLLQEHRWLDDRCIHDWLDYAGRFLRSKYSTANRQRLVEIWSKHGLVYGDDSKASRKRVNSEQKAHTHNLPTSTHPPNARSALESSSSWGAEDEAVNRLLRETGLAPVIGPKHMPEARSLVAISGYESALAAVRFAIDEKGCGGPAAISYAAKKVAGEKAHADRKSTANGKHKGPNKTVMFKD
jgi:hypothetical protein